MKLFDVAPIIPLLGSTWLISLPYDAVLAAPLSDGLIDPAMQPMFSVMLPNPLDPSFIYNTSSGYIEVSVSEGEVETGLVDADGEPLSTKIWGYGTPDSSYTWPGRTFQVQRGETMRVKWLNRISIEKGYLLTGKGDFEGQSVVDTSLHWCYSLPGYESFTIEEHGVPIVVHLHGSHSDSAFDGNPDYFFTPDFAIKGPYWEAETYVYDNDQNATCLFYHDHALGITRLNVHAGMAGFYFIRDELDTGKHGNPLNLPAYPYEVALLIQDRMFKENGELFFPAFAGDPYYDDFISNEDVIFPKDKPSNFAEFFGDVVTVNGYVIVIFLSSR